MPTTPTIPARIHASRLIHAFRTVSAKEVGFFRISDFIKTWGAHQKRCLLPRHQRKVRVFIENVESRCQR